MNDNIILVFQVVRQSTGNESERFTCFIVKAKRITAVGALADTPKYPSPCKDEVNHPDETALSILALKSDTVSDGDNPSTLYKISRSGPPEGEGLISKIVTASGDTPAALATLC